MYLDIIIEDGNLKELRRREKQGADPLNTKDAAEAMDFINVYWREIVNKWVAFMIYRQKVVNTKITKRIR